MDLTLFVFLKHFMIETILLKLIQVKKTGLMGVNFLFCFVKAHLEHSELRFDTSSIVRCLELIALKLNSSCKSSSGQLQPPFVQDTLLSFFQSSSEKQSSSISDSADANFSILSQYLNSYFYNITTTTNQVRVTIRLV